MRPLACLLLTTVAYGAPLIHVSNEPSQQNLQLLEKKYTQPLLISGGNVYIIPKACQLERYFGGASEEKINQVATPLQTESIIVTEEVFDAKDPNQILKKIELEKSIALVEGKISKAFLDDKEGRGFGGASEVALDLSSQKEEAILTAKTVIKQSTKEKTVNISHPSCQLLGDGSGYRLEDVDEGKIYSNTRLSPLQSSTVLFR